MINKYKSFLFIVLLLPSVLIAQQISKEELIQFNKERLKIQKNGMAVLGGWAVANMAASTVGYYSTDGVTAQFYKMNIIWNSVNLVLAVPSYLGAGKGKTDMTLKETFKMQSGMEKIFIANACLDAAYVVGGLYMTERSKNMSTQAKKDQWEGYGYSVMMQGGFLMLFDATMFVIQNNHGNKKLYNVFDRVSLSSQGLGVKYRF
jgi:hypothetical protein